MLQSVHHTGVVGAEVFEGGIPRLLGSASAARIDAHLLLAAAGPGDQPHPSNERRHATY